MPRKEPGDSPAIEKGYWLVFVNSPIQSLIDSRVQLDFDAVDTVTIGRDPQNIVVIPESDISRFHASLRKEGNKIILEDLKSTNGTYLEDGKEFRRVDATTQVKLNSQIMIGKSTVLKLVRK
ncbi:MAG TPA: FHA domain-containing protein [Candidatus Binatus sp.]|nr:FHA domain-containing protein [Candidatus Binatus sp.]